MPINQKIQALSRLLRDVMSTALVISSQILDLGFDLLAPELLPSRNVNSEGCLVGSFS